MLQRPAPWRSPGESCPNNARRCVLEHTDKNCSKLHSLINCIIFNKLSYLIRLFLTAHKFPYSVFSGFLRRAYFEERSHLNVEFQSSNYQNFYQHPGFNFYSRSCSLSLSTMALQITPSSLTMAMRFMRLCDYVISHLPILQHINT